MTMGLTARVQMSVLITGREDFLPRDIFWSWGTEESAVWQETSFIM